MTAYRYRTLQRSGAVVEGEIDAPDEAAAVARLQAADTYPLEVSVAGGRGARKSGTALGARELILFMRELATLAAAGVPLDRALDLLATLKPRTRTARVAEELRTALVAGERFAAAVAGHAAFPRLAGAMLAAGEAQGDLAGALARIASYLERSRLVSQSVWSALVYPLSVVVVGILSTVFLLVFVVPRFAGLLEGLGRELPAGTQLLVDVAAGVGVALPWLLLLAVGAGAAFLWRWRDPAFRLGVDRRVLRLPVIGELVRNVESERMARLCAGLVAAGVVVPEALAITGETAGNRVLAAAASLAATATARGDGVAAALGATGVLPDLVIELTRVGEESGALPVMLEKAADILRQENESTVTRLVALVAPVSTVVLGVVVGGLILAIFSAVMSAYEIGL